MKNEKWRKNPVSGSGDHRNFRAGHEAQVRQMLPSLLVAADANYGNLVAGIGHCQWDHICLLIFAWG